MKINSDGNLEIDLSALLDTGTELSNALAKQLGSSASFNRALAGSVVNHLLSGNDNGAWWGREFSGQLRKQLCDNMPKAVGIYVHELEVELAATQADAQRFATTAMTLARAWENMDDERRRQAQNPDSEPYEVMTQDEAVARVQAMIDEDPEVAARFGLPTTPLVLVTEDDLNECIDALDLPDLGEHE